METGAALKADSHPAPHRHRVGIGTLTFNVLAAPSVWALRLYVNYGLASRYCFPGQQPRPVVPRGPGWIWPTLLALDLLTLALAAMSIVLSYRNWRLSRQEMAGRTGDLLEIGEGRTRFLALWGMVIGAGFAVATGFDLIALLWIPLCAD